jgi:y4mF family transcriptional regulator
LGLHEEKAPAILPIGKTNMTPIELGKIIRRTRESLKLRQDQLAGAAGVGVRFIGELEAGKPTTQIGKALAVLDALGCRVLVETPSALDTVR